MTTDNVVPFRKPDPPPPSEDPLYFVTLYPHSSIITDPNNPEVDRLAVCEALFDNTFNVFKDNENIHILIALTEVRNITTRDHGSFETKAQHAWLARRLDDVYETCTGRNRNPIRAFFSRLNPFRKGRSE